MVVVSLRIDTGGADIWFTALDVWRNAASAGTAQSVQSGVAVFIESASVVALTAVFGIDIEVCTFDAAVGYTRRTAADTVLAFVSGFNGASIVAPSAVAVVGHGIHAHS